ncbi:unnamed protein product [Auanema sp. JU1783]|nr:unnamed protein product [Auanema sp. JU1783]
MRGIFLLLALTAFVSARYVVKRNAYGDEQVTPAPQPVVEVTEAAPVEEAPVVVPQETPAPAPAPAPVPDCNVAPAPVAPEAPAVVDSGYRSKRNAYGDEQVTPAAEPVVEVTEAAPVEEAPVVVPQETPAPAPVPDCNVAPAPVAPEAPAVVDSGYRAKRNAYGDEQVTPAAEPVVEVTEAAPVEEAPVVVPQETPAPAPAPAPVPDCNVAPAPAAPETPAVVDSGYRSKRNVYGDEQVTPAPEPVVEATEAAPVEEAPVVVPQETPAPAPVPDCNVAPAPAATEAPAVEESGYRS